MKAVDNVSPSDVMLFGKTRYFEVLRPKASPPLICEDVVTSSVQWCGTNLRYTVRFVHSQEGYRYPIHHFNEALIVQPALTAST